MINNIYFFHTLSISFDFGYEILYYAALGMFYTNVLACFMI